MALSVLALTFGCSSPQGDDQQSQEFLQGTQQQDDYGGFEDDDSLFSEDEKAEMAAENEAFQKAHPRVATPWETKILLLTTPHPPNDQLRNCRSEMLTLASDAINTDALVTARSRILPEITKDSTLYHWCFYFTMGILDDDLSNDNLGILYEERNQQFLHQIKSLWILASSLDESEGSDKYFTYLRRRYRDLSREFFARDLMIVMPPLGKDYIPTNEAMQKPAGRFAH